MLNVYTSCPKFESVKFLLHFVNKNDVNDLLEVYSDRNALPLFNSDNCNGDNFYYPTKEKMKQAIDFWLTSYQTKCFVRWSIIDKLLSKTVGTIELFHRTSEDSFNKMAVLRLDLKSNYENKETIKKILELIIQPAYELFNCNEIITKVPNYAIERIAAVTDFGFTKSENFLIGTHDNYPYKEYWTIKK